MTTSWDDGREFERGQVFFVNFNDEASNNNRPSRLLRGPHRVVVLFCSTFPRNTVAVVPISSLYEADGVTLKDAISSDVILKSKEYDESVSPYNGTIAKDSFIMTNQIRSVTRSRLERQVGEILPKDMIKLDIQLIETLSLSDTVQQMIETEVEKRLAEMGYVSEEAE
ncbi:type II toxin-antitoxin system PemK/MazF family toxin [Paenibacillus sp. sgz302251]|uniref:type II toxin-antitoxin system PemK/MazF family toxin n=1 Tax=Paenibacillus sp. sgz302251 TaxID=3414493 RepID=UPI003C7E1008